MQKKNSEFEIEIPTKWYHAINLTVIVAGLGYFVDMFDITLLGVIRVSSLKSLGITDPKQILDAGVILYNMQAIGMLIGGVLWGVLADKKGRLSVLFGSIILYSIGNILNAFAWDVNSYAFFRFITGIGLAGELGAAITIVAESLPKKLRGIGTTIVATLGLTGSMAAAFLGQKLEWKTAFIIGGLMGLGLLVTRMKMKESIMFHKLEESNIERGNLLMLANPKRLKKFLFCILVGSPIYFITGILMTFSPELTKALNVQGEVTAGNALLWGSIGLAVGDLASGLLSQILKSRKKAALASLISGLTLSLIYLLKAELSAQTIYVICLLVGCAAGYWAVLVTMAAEQFGTNLRGTVATTIPNFVRGSAVLVTLSFSTLKKYMPLEHAALIIGLIWFSLAVFSLWHLEETFSKDLNYNET